MYFVYVLLLKNNRYYYGFTSDLERRLLQHKNGKVKSTKNRFVGLLYGRTFTDKQEAMGFEKYLKKLRNKKAVDSVFRDSGEVAKLVTAPV